MASISQPISLAPTTTPAYKLFDSNAVGLATFFGSPIAGATLMMVNDSRLGRTGRGIATLLGAIVVTGLVILVGWNIPNGASGAIAIALFIGMKYFAQAVQGKAVKEHVEHGGSLGSKWVAFGISVAFLVVLFGGIFVVIYAQTGPKVVIGSKDEVYYTGTATKDEATALGNALKSDGYFKDLGTTVLLDKGASGTVVSFVVKEGIWNQPDMVTGFEEVGRAVAPAIGGFPIQIRLVNDGRDVKGQFTVGSVAFGKDTVYYFGTATQAQAQALGESLKSINFFQGNGADVFLAHNSDGTSISFVVADGAWDNPTYVGDFEKIARNAAPGVGGLPLHLRLINTTLDVKKDEALN